MNNILKESSRYKENFRNKGNWQPLCKSCHDKKTAIEIQERRNLKKI